MAQFETWIEVNYSNDTENIYDNKQPLQKLTKNEKVA